MTQETRRPPAPVALLGIPWDRHSSYARGPAAAPLAIRKVLADEAGNWVNSRFQDLRDPQLMIDVGDVGFDVEAGESVSVSRAVTAQLDRGRPVLSLGGDHAATYPVFRAYAGRYSGVAIVHIDAHPDLHESFQGDPLSHASPFARIMERGLSPRLMQIGIRASDDHQRRQAARFGVETFGPDAVNAAISRLPAGPVYVSIDMDGLDPACAPGVNHPEPGGLTVREVLAIIGSIGGPIIGADIVELSPSRDVNNLTAKVCAKLVKELVGVMRLPGA